MEIFCENVSSRQIPVILLDLLLYKKGIKCGWLQARLSSNLGTIVDNACIRTAAALRLGCRICLPHPCCGFSTDQFNHDALRCNKSVGRCPSHSVLNKIPAKLEPPDVSRPYGRRVDGLGNMVNLFFGTRIWLLHKWDRLVWMPEL